MKETQTNLEQIVELEFKNVRESNLNPRMNFDGLEDLIQSIKENGILVPMLARKQKDKCELLDGARRLRAAKKAGLTKGPFIIRDVPDKLVAETMFNANEHASLKPVEQARALKSMQDAGHTIKEIAKRTGRSEAAITEAPAKEKDPEPMELMPGQKEILKHIRAHPDAQHTSTTLAIQLNQSTKTIEDLALPMISSGLLVTKDGFIDIAVKPRANQESAKPEAIQ